MRLKRLAPTLPPDLQPLIPILDAAGLKSTDQIVHTPSTTVFRSLTKPVAAEFTRKGYERLLERCLEVELGGRGPVLGSKLDSSSLTTTTTSGRLAPKFGLESLDDLLVQFLKLASGHGSTMGSMRDDGRFKEGILEVAGTKSSGRTLLSLHLILTTLLQDPNTSCLWIDTEASFDLDRTRLILDSIFRKKPNQGDPASSGTDVELEEGRRSVIEVPGELERDRQAEQVLKRLELVNVFDLDGAKASLEASLLAADDPMNRRADEGMEEEMEDAGLQQREERGGARKMIVIDSIASILSPCLSTGDSHGRAKMQAFLDGLSTTVHRNGILCVIINSTTSLTGSRNVNPHPSIFSTTTIKPSLGIGFTYTADVTLLLQTTAEVFEPDPKENNGRGGSGRTVVEVLKNRMGPSSTWTVFQTDGIDIHDVSP